MINISAALSDPELGFLLSTVRRMISTPCRNCTGIASARMELIDAPMNSPV